MVHEIYMPKMSDHMETGHIVRWLVKEGDVVQRGQIVLELETDKAVGEIEAPADGVLKGIRAGEGEDVPVGETLAYVAEAGEVIPSIGPINNVPVATPSAPGGNVIGSDFLASAQANPGADGDVIFATPVARHMAKELGIDLRLVHGTGPMGRIKREDMQALIDAKKAGEVQLALPPKQHPITKTAEQIMPTFHPESESEPYAPASPTAAVEDIYGLSHIQRITGQRMLESVTTAPHFSLQVGVDMSKVQAFIDTINRRVESELRQRVSVTAFMVRVVGVAIKKHPRVNAQFVDGGLRGQSEINIGVAIGIEQGLVVPVIRNAERKILAKINHELKGFQVKARDMRFTPADLEGGTFTISNLGMFGIDVFTAIINPPQSAILAIGRIIKTPVVADDDSIVVRPIANFTLSVDHRVLDGLQAARFLVEIKNLIENPELLI